MKRSLAVGFLMVLFSLSMHAAQSSARMLLSGPVQVGATTLPAGDCKVSWTGSGPDVQLTLVAAGQKSVTVTAHLVEKKSASRSLTTNTVKGVEVLQEIVLEKETFVLAPTQGSGN
jgi:hypothetical protein